MSRRIMERVHLCCSWFDRQVMSSRIAWNAGKELMIKLLQAGSLIDDKEYYLDMTSPLDYAMSINSLAAESMLSFN